MRAAILNHVNEPLRLTEVNPMPLAYGQVLVKITCSGICGAQLSEIRGEKGDHFPRLMGHEGCGIVEDIGPCVTTVKKGEKVVLHWRKGDGIESDFPRYCLPDLSVITSGRITTFSDYSVISENRCTAVPDDTPDELAALLGCGLSTALGTIEHEAQVKFGERVLIIGCGGLGLNLILAAKMAKAAYICACDVLPEKMETAILMGANQFSGLGWGIRKPEFDVVIETSGTPSGIEIGMDSLAPSGRFIMVGQPKPREAIRIPNARHLFDGCGCHIMATQGGRFNPAEDIPRYIALWRSGGLNVDGVVTHRMSLDQINEGLDLVRNGQAGRVMIVP